jgi:PmbA protein
MQQPEDSLINDATRLLKLASFAGAEESEVFGISSRSVSANLRKNRIELAGENIHCGLGLRAIVKGAVGFSSTSNFDKLEMVAESAVRAARARGFDEDWKSLPPREMVKRPIDIFDPAIDGIIPEECLDFAAKLLDGCDLVPGTEPVSGGVSCASFCEVVVNSQGVEVSERGTYFHAGLDVIAKENGVATGYEFDNSRLLSIKFEDIGRDAAEMAKSSAGGIMGESGEFEVLLRPVALADLIEYTFVPSLIADNVQKGRSSLANRIGECIGEDNLNISDDGLLKGGMGTGAFDGEGVPSKRNILIEDGALKGFLYDSYTAGKSGVKSTGSAVRAGYSELPAIGIRNMIVESRDPFDLVEDTARGVLVNGVIGAHTANSVSGDFSVEARNAFNIVDGEIKEPIKSLMIAGNIFDVLKDIQVGTDTRSVGSIVAPTIKARMKVVVGG